MSTVGEKIKNYTSKVEEIDKERARLEGKFEAGLDSLKKKYGVESLEEAEKLQKKKTTESEGLKKELDADMKEFERLYGELLNWGISEEG